MIVYQPEQTCRRPVITRGIHAEVLVMSVCWAVTQAQTGVGRQCQTQSIPSLSYSNCNQLQSWSYFILQWRVVHCWLLKVKLYLPASFCREVCHTTSHLIMAETLHQASSCSEEVLYSQASDQGCDTTYVQFISIKLLQSCHITRYLIRNERHFISGKLLQ